MSSPDGNLPLIEHKKNCLFFYIQHTPKKYLKNETFKAYCINKKKNAGNSTVILTGLYISLLNKMQAY